MIIAVTSHKGGSGKTTTAVNLAYWLTAAGAPVLLVDLDPQGHSAIALGLDPAPGVFAWLVQERMARDCVQTARMVTGLGAPLFLLPGDSKTHVAETMIRMDRGGLAGTAGDLRMIGAGLGCAHTVIDTSSAGILQEAAILAADVLVIPARVEALGVDGVLGAASAAAQLRPDGGLRVLVLPVALDRRLREHGVNLEILRREFAGQVCAPVPARVAVAEAQASGLTIFEFCSGSGSYPGGRDVAHSYAALGQAVLGGGSVAQAVALSVGALFGEVGK